MQFSEIHKLPRTLAQGEVQSRLTPGTNLPGSSEVTLRQRFYEHEATFGRCSGWNFSLGPTWLEGDEFEHALYTCEKALNGEKKNSRIEEVYSIFQGLY